MYDVIIVGAGASGLMLSNILKKENVNIKVLLLEKNDKVGKKLLITGNGKCNFGNKIILENNYNNNKYFDDINNYKNIYLDYIKSFGILIKEDKEGRIYPYNEQAKSVCKVFEKNLNLFGVDIKYNYEVKSIEKKQQYFIINNNLKTKNLVIATGGLSYPKTGSTGDGYKLLKKFNHNITNLYPSLVKLKTNYKNIKLISGVRANCNISLLVNNKVIKEEKGQVQFVDNYVSGICVFNLSRNIKKFLSENNSVCLNMDFAFDFSYDYLKKYILSFRECKITDVLYGILNNKLVDAIISDLKLYAYKVKDIKENKIELLINYIKNMKFNIIDTGDFNEAQVTSGGAELSEFDNHLQSNYVNNLYAVGEVLDVDGICGGYNLSWAFISALIVSKDILRKYNN